MNQNPIPTLCESIYSAVYKDLADLEYDYRAPGSDPTSKIKKLRRPAPFDCDVVMFSQVWGSTALGFGGIGGAAMTSAYTVIVFGPSGDAAVYFGGRLAYHIDKPNELFSADMHAQHMAPTKEATKYITHDTNH